MEVIEKERTWSGAATPETVRRLRQAVIRFASEAGLSGLALDAVGSCVSEAVTNAVVHAFRDDRAPATIDVSTELRSGELIVTVIDDGIGFHPRTDSPGLGLGLPTIVALTASMSVAARAGGGTELCMAFALADRAPEVELLSHAVAPTDTDVVLEETR